MATDQAAITSHCIGYSGGHKSISKTMTAAIGESSSGVRYELTCAGPKAGGTALK